MEIKEKDMLKFIDLYEKHYGDKLTTTQAQPMLLMLLEYVVLCLEPLANCDENDITDMPD
jgi:hypothetical protein